jgi:transposase
MVTYMAFPMPRNLDSARDIIAKQEREITTQQNEITTSKAMADHQAKRISLLEALLRLERARRYGRSSEQYADPNDPQGCLFDEGELEACVLEGSVEDEEETQEVATHTRTVKRGKRGPLPDYLDRERVEHTRPKSALLGPNGECFTKIGEVITEQLDIVPATVRVIEHVRFQYAVKGLDELGVKIAPLPGQPIPKSIATPGLLAHVVTSKYCHHLPLYRQEQIWAGLDVHLPRNTLCRWVIRLGELVQDLVDYQFAEMKQHRHIHVDETRVTVLTEKKAT